MDESTRQQIERARRMTPDERFREGFARSRISIDARWYKASIPGSYATGRNANPSRTTGPNPRDRSQAMTIEDIVLSVLDYLNDHSVPYMLVGSLYARDTLEQL